MATSLREFKFSSETEVISTAAIFKLSPDDAMRELNDQIRTCRIYARAKNHGFLAYLLNMAEIEARRLATEPDSKTG